MSWGGGGEGGILLWNLCTLYLPTCQVRVSIGDSVLCCCIPVLSSAIYSFCLLIHYAAIICRGTQTKHQYNMF